MLPTIATGNVASAIGGGYEVANSCRFNDGDSANLSKTPGSASNRRTFTFSTWVKQTLQNSGSTLISAGTDISNGPLFIIDFITNQVLRIEDSIDGDNVIGLRTTQLYRDPASWYNIVVAIDTTQGTAANRVKLYVNGVQVTSFGTETYPDQNLDLSMNVDHIHRIGTRATSPSGKYLDGYLAETVLIDGLALAPTSFGEFNEDSPNIWQPIDVSGLTFGTNGFYLDYEDSANLGNDANGGTDWTENNIAATDQATDTPTNNFATWNPLVSSNGTLSEGNVKYVTSNSSSNYGYRLSTIGMSSGKWYCEVKYAVSTPQALIGIRSREATSVAHWLGYYNDDYSIYTDGHYYNNQSETTNANASWTDGDIIGIYLDLDNNKLYFSKNGSLYSATGISITAAASTTTGFYFFAATEWNSSGNGTFEGNFGNPSFSITSGNTDGDYGNFEYSTTITGDGSSKVFKALNTKNLAEYG